MGKPRPATADDRAVRLETATADAREVLAELHSTLKSVRDVTTAANTAADRAAEIAATVVGQVEAAAQTAAGEALDDAVAAMHAEFLDRLSADIGLMRDRIERAQQDADAKITKAQEAAVASIYREFDDLLRALLHIDSGTPVADMVRAVAARPGSRLLTADGPLKDRLMSTPFGTDSPAVTVTRVVHDSGGPDAAAAAAGDAAVLAEDAAIVAKPAVVACADLVQRTGASQFQIGRTEISGPDGKVVALGPWFASCAYQGKPIQVEGFDGPQEAADALAIRLLTGGKCRCGRLVALTPLGATAHDGTLADGTRWTVQEARQAGQCRWRRTGDRWNPDCPDPADRKKARR